MDDIFNALVDDTDPYGVDWQWDMEAEPGHAFDAFDFFTPSNGTGLGAQLDTIPEPESEDDTPEGVTPPVWRQPWPALRRVEWLDHPDPTAARAQGFPAAAEAELGDMDACIELVRFGSLDWTAVGYVDPELPGKLFNAKSWFDGRPEFRSVRDRANPYERVGKNVFRSRAGVKMCEIDHAAGLLHGLRNERLLRMGDICAAPGGFTEYLLWAFSFMAGGDGGRWHGAGQSHAAAFTITLEPLRVEDPKKQTPRYELRNSDLVRMARHQAAWIPVRGTPLAPRRGDIMNQENMRNFLGFCEKEASDAARSGRGMGCFIERTLASRFTDCSQGLQLIVADGGADVSFDYNKQELLMKGLILAEVTLALGSIAKGGSFVLKLFDCFAPFSVEMLWILRQCFARIAIFKPISSRPANSERYFIGQGFLYTREQIAGVVEKLAGVVEVLAGRQNTRIGDDELFQDVTRLFTPDGAAHAAADEEFVRYVRESNTVLGRLQLRALREIQAVYAGVGARDPSGDAQLVRAFLAHIDLFDIQGDAGVPMAEGSLWQEDVVAEKGRSLYV